MRTDIKARWVETLRSGKYQQTRKRLHRVAADPDDPDSGSVGFCCLGVLCDLAAQEGVVRPSKVQHGVEFYRDGEDSEESGVLPEIVRDWAGLNDRNPATRGGPTLATLNDEGMSFAEIADLIEDQL